MSRAKFAKIEDYGRCCLGDRLRCEGQSKRYPQTAQHRCVEVEFSAIEFRKLAGDRQTKSKAGRTFIEAFTRPQNLWNLIRPQAWPVVLDHNRDRSSIITMRPNLDLVTRPFERVFEQVAGHLIEILLLACNREIARHVLRKCNPLVRIDFSEHIADLVDTWSDRCLRAHWPAQGRGAGPPEMMTDAPLHQYDQCMTVARRIAAAIRQGDGEGRKWRLQPMRQIGDMAGRPLKIGGVLFEQPIELGYQRQNFQRLFGRHSFAPSGPDVGHCPAKPFERTQPEPD